MTTDSMEHLSPEARVKVRALEEHSHGNMEDSYREGIALYEEMSSSGQMEAAAYADFHTAVACFFLYKWGEALFHCQRAIVEFTHDENWHLLCLSNNLLGIIFANQGDMALAINHFTETIQVADEHGETYLSAIARNNYSEACYAGRAFDTIIRVTGEAKALLLKNTDNPGWKGAYLSALTQQLRAYLNLGKDEDARYTMRELYRFHEKYPDYGMDLDEAIARLFFAVRFQPDKADTVLGSTIQRFDDTPDRSSFIYWIIGLMEYLKQSEQTDLLRHVITVMENDMEKVSYPYFQMLLSKYRLELMIEEKRPMEEIYALGLKRLKLADQEQKQVTENLKYYIALQEKLNENRRKIEEVAAVSKTDALTGLANRRAYEEEGQKRFDAAMERGTILGVEILDIDRFKTVNDTFGHEAGDRVLQKLAGVLRQNADENCLPFRLGGDEFVILYDGMDKNEISSRAEKVRQDLAACGGDSGCPAATISQGICFGVPGPETSLSLYLRQADSCLYESKKAGRDCIQIHQAAPDTE